MLANQLVRSAGSVAANYRASCRARSLAECISKFGIVEEEADESLLWLELIGSRGYAPTEEVSSLIREGSEILAITVACLKALKVQAKDKKGTTLYVKEESQYEEFEFALTYSAEDYKNAYASIELDPPSALRPPPSALEDQSTVAKGPAR